MDDGRRGQRDQHHPRGGSPADRPALARCLPAWSHRGGARWPVLRLLHHPYAREWRDRGDAQRARRYRPGLVPHLAWSLHPDDRGRGKPLKPAGILTDRACAISPILITGTQMARSFLPYSVFLWVLRVSVMRHWVVTIPLAFRAFLCYISLRGAKMGAKILIVDDDLESLKLIGLMLQGRGYQIIAAQSGLQALSKAVDESPDLMILDVMMPGMDGLEVCRRLRADPRTAPIPVIMFSARTQVDDKVAGFEAGADEYLTKPIHPAELVTRVEVLLARAVRMGKAAKPSVRAKTVGFLGCKGGVGTSTLAVNVAVALTQGAAAGRQVMLLDFRSALGTLALQLGLSPQKGLLTLSERPTGTLDTDTVLANMDRHSSGVMVLGGMPEPLGTLPSMAPPHVEAIARTLGASADYLLVDMGSGLGEINTTLLRLLTYLLVVVEPQRIALHMAQTLLATLDEMEVGRHRIGIVLVHKAPSATTLTKEMMEGLLQREIVGVIPPAPELAFQAAEQGTPMVMMQAQSLVARQLHQLAEFVASL
ncbi:MAG TPA: response regulator [Anaerolineae bacterium]|nr:response regulator [Anaerolineae bacterium]